MSNSILETFEKGSGEINDEQDFFDRVDDLQEKLDDVCAEEEHAGVTVCALTHMLAVALFDMNESNSGDSRKTIKDVHKHLDELLGQLEEGTYFEQTKLN